MPMFYALVSRGSIVLCEHTPRSGNFNTVTRVLRGKISPSTDAKMSYVYDDFVFHYIVEDGLTYLYVAARWGWRRWRRRARRTLCARLSSPPRAQPPSAAPRRPAQLPGGRAAEAPHPLSLSRGH